MLEENNIKRLDKETMSGINFIIYSAMKSIQCSTCFQL